MTQYDPAAIRKMAAILGTVAMATIVLSALSGIVTGVIITTVASQVDSGVGVLGLVGGLLYGGLIFGVGYLIALVIRVIAQLMLAVVQIESNTRGVGAQATAHAGSPATPVALGEIDGREAPGAPLPVAARRGKFVECPWCGKTTPVGGDRCQWCHKSYREDVDGSPA